MFGMKYQPNKSCDEQVAVRRESLDSERRLSETKPERKISHKGLLLAASLSVMSGLVVFSASAVPANALTQSKTEVLKGRIQTDIKAADDLMLKGKYADAADLYYQAMNQDSKNIQALVGYGTALGKQFKLDAADTQLDKAIQLDPNNAAAHSAKAMVLLNRLQSSNNTIIKNRDSILQQAWQECNTALQIDSKSPEANYNMGQVLKEQGRLDDAANSFRAAIKIDGNFSDAYTGLGLCKLSQESLAEAQDAFQRAIQINSGNSTAHFGLGKTYLKLGQLDAAIKELNTSLYQYPNSGPARLAMGEAYEAQGNTVAAIKEYKQSISIKPENASAYLHIADIRENRGDTELSIAELRSALELMPTNPELRQRIGDECLSLDKLDQAIKEYQTILSQTPNSVPAAQGLTRAYYLKAQKDSANAFLSSNDYEQAEQMIQQAINLNPNNMELRLAQAKMRSLSGKPVDLSAIGTPTNDGERIAYAEALLAQDKFADADSQMNMVISKANDPKQVFAIGDLALMIKDLNAAESAYNKASTMPGSGTAERAKRGLALCAKAREQAKQDLNMAQDLAMKKQLASSIDKYHAAIYDDPKVAQARIGLAKTLERQRPLASGDIREAITQYKAYMALDTNLPEKEKAKLDKHIQQLDGKAYKLEMKAQAQGRSQS